MEYYIYTTYNCNLSCTYCSASRVVSNKHSDALKLGSDQIRNIVNYIKRDILWRRSGSTNSIVFFGGEPTLAASEIAKIIDLTSDLGLTYVMYTNGVVLDEFPTEILSNINVIFFSIDGEKRTHEKYRGKGTYDRIVSNIRNVRNTGKNYIIGRITLEEDVPLFTSALKLLELCDAVHWQIVNKPNFNSPQDFLGNYRRQIEKLFEYWIKEFRKGNILRIVPFQAIIRSLLFQDGAGRLNTSSFRCRVGVDFQVIGLEGEIYQCDEFVGDISRCKGNVCDGKTIEFDYKSHLDIFQDCRECDVSNICLGRCRKCLEDYGVQQRRNYCNLTKSLIATILRYLPEVSEIVKRRDLGERQIYDLPYYNFEEIP